jgi:signal peptidase I
MYPVIKKGDMIIYANLPIRKGDIILYCKNPSFCVSHRVIDVKNNVVITKGDNNPSPDPPVPLKEVKGKVVGIIPVYIWIPLLAVVLAPDFVSYIKKREHYVVVTSITAVVFILLFFFIPSTYSTPPRVEYPVVYLSRAVFDSNTCNIILSFTGGLHTNIVSGRYYINGEQVRSITIFNDTVILTPPLSIISRGFEEKGYIIVNGITTFESGTVVNGTYKVLITGKPIDVKLVNETLIISNPNCFPINVTIYMKGNITTHKTMTIDGNHSVKINTIGLRVGLREITVKYMVWGGERWKTIPIPRK